MNLMRRLFSAEIPEPPAWMRPLFTLYVAGFAVLYPVLFLASLHFLFLGPGLGDEFTFRHLNDLLTLAADGSPSIGSAAPLALLLGLIGFSTAFRGWVVFKGYQDYRQALGEDVPMREIVTFGLANLLNLLFAPLFLLGLAGLAALLGHSPADGLQALDRLAGMAAALVQQVPTLVTLPKWPALILTLLAWSLAHYWLHRLSHTRRALWLVLHRPHHMTPHLTYATTLPVFMSFPFFLLLAFPYLLLFGALGKLFSPEPLYLELILLHLVTYIGEIFGHSPAIYRRFAKKPWAVAISQFYGQGLYHVLHHSSAVDCERVSNNNTVNIGPGFFFVWDRLFGTYQPLAETVPPLGLHGNPMLVHNPLRLLVAGVAQLGFELWHNRRPGDRVRILFGPSTWTPPVSRDFAIRETAPVTGIASPDLPQTAPIHG